MWILCGGAISDNMAGMITKATDIPVLGVDIKDLKYTLSLKGVEHFNKVKGIVVLDTGLETLLDLSDLDELVKIAPISLIHRHPEVVKDMNITGVRHFIVEEIYVKDVQALIYAQGGISDE